jgi:hypothetical protein
MHGVEEFTVPSIVRNQKDFYAGAVYLTVGIIAIIVARGYPLGSASRMGPGYFPTILGGLLVVFGIVSLARSFVLTGEPIGRLPWKPLALVVGAVAFFAALLPHVGFVIALAILITVSAAASAKFRFEWRGLLGFVALLAFCALVFVLGLGLPLPLLGSWFGSR